MAFGRKILSPSSGIPVAITYDGAPKWKAGGITIDWTTVAAVSGSPAVLAADEITVAVGQSFLRYGQLMCQITATGLFGPFDPAASDGRQTIAPGLCGFLNQTVLQNGVLGVTVQNTDNVGLVIGGMVWLARLIQSGTGTHSLAAGPTFAEMSAALPTLTYAQ